MIDARNKKENYLLYFWIFMLWAVMCFMYKYQNLFETLLNDLPPPPAPSSIDIQDRPILEKHLNYPSWQSNLKHQSTELLHT